MMQILDTGRPTIERVKEYFEYFEESGLFVFKKRGKSEFKTEACYARHKKRIGEVAGSKNSDGYIKLHIDGKYHSAHRIAWLLMENEWVEYPEFEIDHIDGNRANNAISNLRKVTKSENQRNSSKRANNTSGVHGVNWKQKHKHIPGDGRWVARIWNGPKHVYLGAFKTLHEAAIARKAAERVLGFTGSKREPFSKQKET